MYSWVVDTITNNIQSKTKQEEHHCIKALAKPTEPTELTEFCLKIKEDHFQAELIMNMEAWQDQEEAKGSLPFQQTSDRTEGWFKAYKQQNKRSIELSASPPYEPWRT